MERSKAKRRIMQTLGKLLDEFIIEQIRCLETGSTEAVKCCKLLSREINEFLNKKNKKQFIPKYKIYSGKKAPYVKIKDIPEAIMALVEANYIIWELEDLRRKDNLSAKTIIEINKKSNKYNNIRSNMINEIDRLNSLK